MKVSLNKKEVFMSDLDKESKELFSTNPLKGEKTLQRMKNVVREAPIIGTALDVVDIGKDIVAGNWGSAATGVGLALLGTTPAGRVISKGVDKGADAIKKTAKALTKDADTDAVDDLGLTAKDLEEWKSKFYKKDKWRVPQNEDLAKAAKSLREGEITPSEFRELAEAFSPIVPLTKMPKFPTKKEVAQALHATDKRKTQKGIIGVNKTIEDGALVSSRLDIPAYNSSDTWVVTLHDGAVDRGDTIAYSQTAVLNDVVFKSDPLAASKIATGSAKSTIARANGTWENMPPEEVYDLASKLLKDDEWVQVGMNPYRASYFYDKADGMPIVSAEKVIQVGPLVLAKKAKKTTPDDDQFEFYNKITDVTSKFSTGGLVTRGQSEKGIKTQEGIEMANKRFQLDEDQADLNKDGLLSPYEKQKGEAIQKTEIDKDMDVVKAYDGVGIIPKEDPVRQDFLDKIPGLQDGITIRDGTGYKRYAPIFDGEGFAGWEENADGPVVLYPTKVGGKTRDIFYLLDNWLPATEEKIEERNWEELPYPKDPIPQKPNPDDIENIHEDVFPPDQDPVDPPNPDDIENIENDVFPPDEDPEPEKSWWEKFKDNIPFLAHGGLMADSCGCGMPDCMTCSSVGYDDVSGNNIPLGSSAENVRDDIPAALSTGEYVLPANVVRWHGLKHIQGMMDEAKMGLMSMKMEGQIHEIEEEESHSKESEDADSKDADSTSKKGKESTEEEIKTPEGNVIEVATIEVVEEKPNKSSLPIKKKPKVAYAK